jgi:4-hydroxybenzoate polyprenyltransferase
MARGLRPAGANSGRGVAVTLEARALPTPPPLCVDLEGTLILGDSLFESLMLLIKQSPLFILRIPLWLLRGTANLKAEVGARIELDPAALAYNKVLLDWLGSERRTGRSLWLCTAANEQFASRVAAHLGLFDGVLASDAPVKRFGEGGFDYCPEFPDQSNRLRAMTRALRPHQWAKNVLLLVPLLAAHHVGEPGALAAAILAMLAFCLCASSVYVLNDLLDLQADRLHPRKSKRPFAAGELSIVSGLLLSAVLLAATVVVALFLPAKFCLVLAAYYVVTSAYSLFLKRFLLVDALALAGLYTLRIIAGAAAVVVELSFWLLLFSIFLFLSLAFVKRFAELEALRRQQRLRAAGRGYLVEDLPVLQSLGIASGYLSVLVLALYINSPAIEALYHRPKAVWMLCVLLLYWISRVWMTAQRGNMHDDPVVFALKDRQSLAIGVCAAVTLALAI